MSLLLIICFSLISFLIIFMLIKIQNLQKTTNEFVKTQEEKIFEQNKIELSKNNLNLKDIENITLVDNTNSEEIIKFKKINLNKISNFKYREVNFDGGNLASSISTPIIFDSMIKMLNHNGLFTATVNSNTLIQYTQGGFSSMISGTNGKILKHSGFLSANSSVFTPMIVFQVLSFVTGQYYLNGINKQLSKISNKIDDLQFFIESEDYAKINVIQEELSNLSVIQQNFDMISNFKIQLKFIKEKYKINIQKIINEINEINKDDIDSLEEKKNRIRKYSDIFYITQHLLFYIEQIEFFSCIKNKDLRYINDVYNRINNYTVEKLYFDKMLEKIEKLKKEIGTPFFGDKDEKIRHLNYKFKTLDNDFEKEFNDIKKDINSAKRNLNKKWEESKNVLLYIDENNNQRLFVRDTNDDLKKVL